MEDIKIIKMVKKDFYNKPLSTNEEKRTLKCIFISSEKDMSNDIIDIEGADFSYFESVGKPVLFNHNPNKQIGNSEWQVRENKTWVGQPNFLDDLLAEECWRNAKKGTTKGWSVSFKPLEYKLLEDGGIHYTKYSVAEYSLTPIPDNPKCVTKSLIEKCLRESVAEEFVNYYESELRFLELKENLEKKCLELEQKHADLFDKYANLNEILKVYENKVDGMKYQLEKSKVERLLKV